VVVVAVRLVAVLYPVVLVAVVEAIMMPVMPIMVQQTQAVAVEA
tara:strand:- start:34 stop:165 length:132 start_codon:yes stop_codon:yes gene_type:complete